MVTTEAQAGREEPQNPYQEGIAAFNRVLFASPLEERTPDAVALALTAVEQAGLKRGSKVKKVDVLGKLRIFASQASMVFGGAGDTEAAVRFDTLQTGYQQKLDQLGKPATQRPTTFRKK